MKKYDDELDFDEALLKEKTPGKKQLIFSVCGIVILVAILLILIFTGKKETKETLQSADSESTLISAETEATEGETLSSEDTTSQEEKNEAGELQSNNGSQVHIIDQASMTETVTYGIDVAKYQGIIDWSSVANSGVDYAMIRVGHRSGDNGEILADPTALYNLQEATANGIRVGAYFFSTAITVEEAQEEADWVANYIANYAITYPVVYNCEGFEKESSRQYSLTKAERTDIAMAYLERIYENGYTPMFYAARNELQDEAKWETKRIEDNYLVWVAWYPGGEYSQESGPEYTGKYGMWQHTNSGSVAGISETVDMDVCYFGYAKDATPHDTSVALKVTLTMADLMEFDAVNETVTAKDVVNLRDIPSQGEDSNVLASLKNGETATRTGVSETGWSRVECNGGVYYAVSNYLTTDLTVQAPVADVPVEDDGIKTEFVSCNEAVTPKIEINLRLLPSVTNPEATVVATIRNGEVITRTGINTDYGWSRVEYNGQTLYCVSSYLQTVQQ